MPKIITTAHQKGGVGKTTLAISLYHYFTLHGVNAALVDVDPQNSVARLYQTMGQADNWGELELLTRKDFKQYPDLLALDYDLLVIDTPPAYVNVITEVFAVSDFVLVPCKTSPLDLLAIEETMIQLDIAIKHNKTLKAGIVFNQVIPNTKFIETARTILEQKYNYPILETVVHNRTDFSTYLMRSIGIEKTSNTKASQEIAALANEIITILNQ